MASSLTGPHAGTQPSPEEPAGGHTTQTNGKVRRLEGTASPGAVLAAGPAGVGAPPTPAFDPHRPPGSVPAFCAGLAADVALAVRDLRLERRSATELTLLRLDFGKIAAAAEVASREIDAAVETLHARARERAGAPPAAPAPSLLCNACGHPFPAPADATTAPDLCPRCAGP